MLMTLFLFVLYLLAGLCLFLFLLNRSLIWMPDGSNKLLTMAAAFAITMGGGALLGWALPREWRLAVPCGVLALFSLGEVRRWIIRHRHRGSAPVVAPNGSAPYLSLSDPVTTTDLAYYHYEIALPGWTGPPLRIAQLSDFHVNGGLPHSFYRCAVMLAREANPDLLFVTGDFVTGLDDLYALSDLLVELAAPNVYAVLGNHDYWADAERIGGMVREAGIRLLTDESIVLERSGALVRLTGYDSPWGECTFVPPATRPGELHLVLSHSPDNIYRLREMTGAHAVFSGHYHAGQFRLPWVGPVIVPSRYGRRFDHGHFLFGGTHLFVSGGVGSANPALRLYCQPDVFVVDIVPA